VRGKVEGNRGTHEDERTVLFKTISLDGIKPNTNPKTNPNPNTNPNSNRKLTLILTLFSCFMLFLAPSSNLQSSRVSHPGTNRARRRAT